MTHRSMLDSFVIVPSSIVCLSLVVATRTTAAQAGTVRSEQEISRTQGGFGGGLGSPDHFGFSVCSLGDLDGDGTTDLAVGAEGDDSGNGAAWIVFLNANGTVASKQKISETTGNLGGDLAGGQFGASVAPLGDLDGDGIVDLAVGAHWDGDGGPRQGAVWILFLNTDGTVASEQKISETAGGFGGDLDPFDFFGCSVSSLGDLNGDGNQELAVGALEDDDGHSNQGAVWLLSLNADGTVASTQKISDIAGFGGDLEPGDRFGVSLATLEDLDGDGNQELAVGAFGDNDGGVDQGAVWILFLNADGTVASRQRISETAGGFGGVLDQFDAFGRSVTSLGDLDGDGNPDLAVGVVDDDDGGLNQGAVWVLFLNPDGTVASEQKISEAAGGFGGDLDENDEFGTSVTKLGDLNGDGVGDLAAGAPNNDSSRGALWILFLEGCPKLDFESEDNFETALVNGQHIDTEFGELVTLTSSGANAGLAIFDSTPGGPNDPSQDPDLLVDSGNVLILQTENLPPDANDIFPRPNDDEDGGTITFEFTDGISPASLRLIDLDAGDGATAVVLTDGAARTRTFTLPSNWTGDLTLGQPGQRVLDLTTLAPQPGFGSLATAVEDAGFDPSDVIRVRVTLDGSGAIDDLAWCQASLPRALAHERHGSGTNAVRLTSLSLPVLGETWNAELDCAAFGTGLATLDVRATALGGRPTPYGELLIAGPLVQRTVSPFAGEARTLGWDLPNDLALCGLELHAQGLCSGTTFARGKTVRRSAWLSNAIDLVLGY